MPQKNKVFHVKPKTGGASFHDKSLRTKSLNRLQSASSLTSAQSDFNDWTVLDSSSQDKEEWSLVAQHPQCKQWCAIFPIFLRPNSQRI